jgi:hypothetical protein
MLLRDDRIVKIHSQDYWFKVVEMLQQNWALIGASPNSTQVAVFFFGDTSGVFDRPIFPTHEAEQGLRQNGFRRCDEDTGAPRFLVKPRPPFREQLHPIYSSGRFWH